jgi:DNA-binding PucR family transcriptional regulator
MSQTAPWDPPSAAAAELIRMATGRLLMAPEALFDEVDQAVIDSQPDVAVSDPRVTAAIRISNRANLAHWAAANLRNPGARVPANLGPETLEIAREIVRRGLDDTSLESYRVGQNIAWRHWMGMAFELGAEPALLREMLDVSARSIFTFVDETLAGIHEAMERERAQLISRTHSERLEIVNLVLENAPITSQRASSRLRYELSRRHTAAIIWSDEPGPRDPGELEAAADAIARATGAERALIVVPSASALWAWVSPAGAPDLERIRREVVPPGEVRVAIGTTDPGIDGFRRSHLHALATQRLMRRSRGELRLAAYPDVQLVALAAQDEERMSEFVTATLGELATAEPMLRDTLREYIRERFSAARTARALFTHRNTVLNRIARAEQLLPEPLADHGVEVGLALEIMHWL